MLIKALDCTYFRSIQIFFFFPTTVFKDWLGLLFCLFTLKHNESRLQLLHMELMLM